MHVVSAVNTIQPLSSYIFISGSYKQNDENDRVCKLLGFLLSSLKVGIISGAGISGINVSQSLYEQRSLENIFDPHDIKFYYRRKKNKFKRLTENIGLSINYDDDQFQLRQRMLSEASAVLVIGGKSGTRQEEQIATSNKIPLIPIALTKGVAEEIWRRYKSNFYIQYDGARAFDINKFDALNSADVFVSVNAAISLLKYALHI